MDDLFEFGKQALAAQPFSALVGAELLSFAPGQAELKLAITERLKQQHGFVHGGVMAYLADNVLTFAGGSVLGPAVVMSEFKINYVRPGLGDALIARSEVIHSGRTQAVCRCEIFVLKEGQESLCAAAQGTINKMNPEA
ncbi:MAG: PaaI family thioesterase [Deltaproteobacteria bacterium]|nr:PaaI family thioesterase [Deltaproteobacteria bacterium]